MHRGQLTGTRLFRFRWRHGTSANGSGSSREDTRAYDGFGKKIIV